ncbi:hypothetical protein CK203_101678 [Vitis vinifera]|uniref:GAG-pre-integrase domain-containing protein n=1 Tax=Vitis vinifera TaxID=29760 RepID=A0A438FHU6_VITVI|nr:hypothetical protein CK203_101678 [Vitis vinifera]
MARLEAHFFLFPRGLGSHPRELEAIPTSLYDVFRHFPSYILIASFSKLAWLFTTFFTYFFYLSTHHTQIPLRRDDACFQASQWDNYSTWCRAMMISLNAKSKLGFIDGTTTMPFATTKPDDYASWKRCNDMVLAWILNSLTQDLADSVIFSTIAQESYNAIRGQILLMNPLPDVAKAYSSIIQEEKQRSLGAGRETIENSAMVVQRIELVALNVRHGQGSSSRSNLSNRKPLHCSYCDRDHHVWETYWKLNGEQCQGGSNDAGSSIGENGLSDLQIQQILSIMQGKGTTQSANSKADAVGTSSGLLQTLLRLYQLIIDSGATDHITSFPTLLVNSSKNTRLPPVAMPSGEQAPITSIGNLPSNSNITLKNVLVVPFFKDLMTKTTIGLGEQRDGLYYLVALASKKPKSQTPSIAATFCRSPNPHVTSSTALWHRRLGHLSSSRLHFIAKHFLSFPFQSNNACDVCALTKQKCVSTAVHIINRLPTPLISRQTPFEPFYGKIPSYATDVHVPHKFASRAKRCIFLGYPAGQKAYKLYDLDTHKIKSYLEVTYQRLARGKLVHFHGWKSLALPSVGPAKTTELCILALGTFPGNLSSKELETPERAAKYFRNTELSSPGCKVGFHLEVPSFPLAAWFVHRQKEKHLTVQKCCEILATKG